MMLGTKEKVVTKVTLEFFNSDIPVFEKFILLFQKKSPVVPLLYNSLCDILRNSRGGFSNYRLLKASVDMILHLSSAESKASIS